MRDGIKFIGARQRCNRPFSKLMISWYLLRA